MSIQTPSTMLSMSTEFSRSPAALLQTPIETSSPKMDQIDYKSIFEEAKKEMGLLFQKAHNISMNYPVIILIIGISSLNAELVNHLTKKMVSNI